MSVKLHSKLGSYLRIKVKVLKRLQPVKAVNGAILSRHIVSLPNWCLRLCHSVFEIRQLLVGDFTDHGVLEGQ